jgi:hypothetical protein
MTTVTSEEQPPRNQNTTSPILAAEKPAEPQSSLPENASKLSKSIITGAAAGAALLSPLIPGVGTVLGAVLGATAAAALSEQGLLAIRKIIKMAATSGNTAATSGNTDEKPKSSDPQAPK